MASQMRAYRLDYRVYPMLRRRSGLLINVALETNAVLIWALGFLVDVYPLSRRRRREICGRCFWRWLCFVPQISLWLAVKRCA